MSGSTDGISRTADGPAVRGASEPVAAAVLIDEGQSSDEGAPRGLETQIAEATVESLKQMSLLEGDALERVRLLLDETAAVPTPEAILFAVSSTAGEPVADTHS